MSDEPTTPDASDPPPRPIAGVPKRSAMQRMQPYVGSVVVVLGLTQFGAMITHEGQGSRDLGGLATGLFIAGSGLGLINRGARRPAEFWSYFAASSGVAVLIVLALR